jgi:tellurite resistance protein TehA-like permease
VVAVVVWAAAVLWIPVLVVSELVWPRWRYRGERWSTVFPLGMYAVCSFAVSGAEHSAPIRDFGRVWLWVAVAAWVATVVGMVVDFSASRSSDGGAFPSKED